MADIPAQRGCGLLGTFIMKGMGKKPRRPRRVFTPEFKAEIVEVCRRGGRKRATAFFVSQTR